MQSSILSYDRPHTTLGERRGKHDLARFSLDLSWTEGPSRGARVGPYPSPPMSSSPSFPANKNPNFVDRGQGRFGQGSENVSYGAPTPQIEPRGDSRPEQLGSYPFQNFQPQQYPQGQRTPSYPPYQTFEEVQRQSQYQHQPEQVPRPLQPATTQQSTATMGLYTVPRETHDPFATTDYDTPQSSEVKPVSPTRGHRKPKGHVAAACVPCKRAHLRCDNARPCARCTSNGKEDTCIDTQHKKRGRPRLRDEREARYEGMTSAYPSSTEAGMRRPLQMYGSSRGNEATLYEPSRSQGYRVLKSQGGLPPPRHLENASTTDTNTYGPFSQYTARHVSREVPCAYLMMNLLIVRTNRAFEEALGASSIAGRRLFEIVGRSDQDKLYRLQRTLEDERQQREPQYLPPIYARAEQERTIQNMSMDAEDISNFQTNRQENITFHVGERLQREFQVRLGLQKFQSTYYVVLLFDIPSTSSPAGQYLQPSPYTRDLQPQYAAQPAPTYGAPLSIPTYSQYQPSSYLDPRSRDTLSRTPSTHMGVASSPAPTTVLQQGPPPLLPSYAQSFQPPVHGSQQLREIPRSQLASSHIHQSTGQPQLQLPPLRLSTVPGQMIPREERRLDIGGLLEDPSIQRGR